MNWTEDIMGWERLGIGRMIFFLVIEGLVFYLILAMVELRLVSSIKNYISNVYSKLVHGTSPGLLNLNISYMELYFQCKFYLAIC